MSRIKFLLAVGCLCLTAITVFTSCGDDPDNGNPPAPPPDGSSSDDGSLGSSSSAEPGSSIACPPNVDNSKQFCWDTDLDGVPEVYDLCGVEKYNPGTMFCFGNKFYLKCGGKDYLKDGYDPEKQFCSDGEPYLKCSGKELDPSGQFCFGSSQIVPKCAGVNFNPDEQFCLEARLHPNCPAPAEFCLYDKCAGNEFYPLEQFCSKDGKLYPLCAGQIYNPLSETCCGGTKISLTDPVFCFEDKIEGKCDGKEYKINTEFCDIDRTDPAKIKKQVYPLCDGEKYNALERFCSGSKFYLLCGGKEYNPSTEFCNPVDNKAYLRCGGKESDPDSEFCLDGKIILFCGIGLNKKEYNPDEQVCVSGVLQPKLKCAGNDMLSSEFCSEGKIYTRCHGNNANLTGEYPILTHSCCYGSVFNIATEFCFEEEKKAYDKCGTTVKITYNRSTHFCGSVDNEIHPICGGNDDYDYVNKFCSSDKLYSKCAGGEYDPIKDFCYKDPANPSVDIGPRLRCGGKEYDLAREFCFDGKIYKKCDSYKSEYNPETHFCFQDKIEDMCGGLQYTPGEQGCHRGIKVYDLCGVSRTNYNPDNQLCFNSIVYSTVCPGFPDAEFCDNNTGYSLCGKNSFNVGIEFCSGGVIRKKCVNYTRKYEPSTEFCTPRDEVRDLCRVAERDNLDNIVRFTLTPYDTDEKQCDEVKYAIVDKGSNQECGVFNTSTHYCCFGQTYPISDGYFCHKSERYPKCSDPDGYLTGVPNNIPADYIPADYICYKGELKPNCSSTKGITGICAYSNSLLRCKQLGDGSKYIIDPLPGMKCMATGEIVGNVAGVGNIVQIGDQIWTKENIGTGTGIGTCPGNYGCRYDWVDAMSLQDGSGLPPPDDDCHYTSKGDCTPSLSENMLWGSICPEGFGIPRPRDWERLVEYAGGAKIAAGRLKSITGWNDNGNGTDNYGFSALPGGYDVNLGGVVTLFEQGDRSIWWTFTQTESEAWYFDMISADTEVRTHYRPKKGGAYVRCVRYGAF